MAKRWTQQKLAELTGLTQPQISHYLHQGVFTCGDSLTVANQKIIKVRGEINSGHAARNGIDRVLEAALLDRAKREEIEIRIAEKRNMLIPADIFIGAISAVFSALRMRLLSLPARLQFNNPNLSHADVASADVEVRDFLTELSDDRFPGFIRDMLAARRNGASAETAPRANTRGPPKSKSKQRRQTRRRS